MPAKSTKDANTTGNRRWLVLILIWSLAATAVLPVVRHWTHSAPSTGPARFFAIGLGYLLAAAICYGIYRAESRSLPRPHAILLAFTVLLLTGLTNNLHSFNVDRATNYFPYPNVQWQENLQNHVVALTPEYAPHPYRFLPNAIVHWMQIFGMSFESGRDLYRLLFGLLLFYSIYKFARLYCNFTGAVIAMAFIAAIYPVSFEHYAGQLADPLSHLSFVLAFIFLETEEFALFLSTVMIGSLAKETVLAMAGYYLLFFRNQRGYLPKAALLCIAVPLAYFGPRFFVLHGASMQYKQVSNVGLDHIVRNILDPLWIEPFLLTACALAPFLVFGWKETPLSLKRLALYLLPVLFLSSAFFSWLHESRNFMPLVYVMAVAAGRYLSSITNQSPGAAVRIDKWLWAARFFKTRPLAVAACELGRIQSNGEPASATGEVKVGDLLQIASEGGDFEVEVLGLSELRGPVPVAQALYRETARS